MAQPNQQYLRPPLLSPDYAKSDSEQESRKPRLTLRYLQQLIEDIAIENGRLAERIDSLATQLDDLSTKLDALDVMREQTAAALEDAATPIAGPEPSTIDLSVSPSMYADLASTDTGWAAVPETVGADTRLAGGRLVETPELSAALQERMIENVREAARIAEEIAAGAVRETAAAAMIAEPAAEVGLPMYPARLDGPNPDTGMPMAADADAEISLTLPETEPKLKSEPGPGSGPAQADVIEGLAQAEFALESPAAPSPTVTALVAQEAAVQPDGPLSVTITAPAAVRGVEAVVTMSLATERTLSVRDMPPRSQRHPSGAKKRSFWSRLFRTELL